jgi:hypothetical protein
MRGHGWVTQGGALKQPTVILLIFEANGKKLMI